MSFIPFWFIIIAVLWAGFFVLEGFDFGVGILHGLVGQDEAGRRAAINAIGPLWDGNEVWLITAAAAMFAAFPGWYATMFSGFYLAILLVLVALIVRGVSFEYRGKIQSARWRRNWDWLMTGGSLLAPLLIGVALGDLLRGVPINGSQEYTGSFANLLQPYAVFTGVTLVAICVLHGATFLALKTTGGTRQRAGRLARQAAPVTGLLVLGFVIWTHAIAGKGALLNPVELAAVLAIFAVVWLAAEHQEGWAFAATTFAMAACIVSIFVDLYPRVMVSSTSAAFNLTVRNTASGGYSLKVMTVVAIVLLPVVLGYQTWTYYVFRRRISDRAFEPADASPALGGVSTPSAVSNRPRTDQQEELR
jgi:cytochrome d ubiquinol oxidase subunit II